MRLNIVEHSNRQICFKCYEHRNGNRCKHSSIPVVEHARRGDCPLRKHVGNNSSAAVDTRKVYFHRGKAGDLIYALPVLKAIGPASLHIIISGRISASLVESLTPLFLKQPYICMVTAGAESRGIDFGNPFGQVRKSGRRLNIADSQLFNFGLPFSWSQAPWLQVEDPIVTLPVIMHRSPRYHNNSFPWAKVLERYRGQIIMVGYPQEHRDFCRAFGDVPYYPTTDYLHLARVIAGGKLFIGNQSSPYAIAEGLKKPTVQEQCPRMANCHWHRPQAVYGRDANVVLPAIAAGSN